MEKISQYLMKFETLRLPSEAVRKVVQEVIRKEIGIELNFRDIQVRCGVVHLSGLSPAARSEIQMRKKDIMQEITEKIPKGSPRDVRLS